MLDIKYWKFILLNFCFFCFIWKGVTLQPRLGLNSQPSICLSLKITLITNVSHYSRLTYLTFIHCTYLPYIRINMLNVTGWRKIYTNEKHMSTKPLMARKGKTILQAALAYLIPNFWIQNNTVASLAGLNPDRKKKKKNLMFMQKGIKMPIYFPLYMMYSA